MQNLNFFFLIFVLFKKNEIICNVAVQKKEYNFFAPKFVVGRKIQISNKRKFDFKVLIFPVFVGAFLGVIISKVFFLKDISQIAEKLTPEAMEFKEKLVGNYNGDNCLVNALYSIWLSLENKNLNKNFNSKINESFKRMREAEKDEKKFLEIMKVRAFLTIKEDVKIAVSDIFDKTYECFKRKGYKKNNGKNWHDFFSQVPTKNLDKTKEHVLKFFEKLDIPLKTETGETSFLELIKNWNGKINFADFKDITFEDINFYNLSQLNALRELYRLDNAKFICLNDFCSYMSFENKIAEVLTLSPMSVSEDVFEQAKKNVQLVLEKIKAQEKKDGINFDFLALLSKKFDSSKQSEFNVFFESMNLSAYEDFLDKVFNLTFFEYFFNYLKDKKFENNFDCFEEIKFEKEAKILCFNNSNLFSFYLEKNGDLMIRFIDYDFTLKKINVLAVGCLQFKHFTSVVKINENYYMVDGAYVKQIDVIQYLENRAKSFDCGRTEYSSSFYCIV